MEIGKIDPKELVRKAVEQLREIVQSSDGLPGPEYFRELNATLARSGREERIAILRKCLAAIKEMEKNPNWQKIQALKEAHRQYEATTDQIAKEDPGAMKEASRTIEREARQIKRADERYQSWMQEIQEGSISLHNACDGATGHVVLFLDIEDTRRGLLKACVKLLVKEGKGHIECVGVIKKEEGDEFFQKWERFHNTTEQGDPLWVSLAPPKFKDREPFFPRTVREALIELWRREEKPNLIATRIS